MRGAGSNKRPGGWRGSAAQIAVGRAAIIKWNRTRHLQPKCGAARKSDYAPCQNLAMANGRCHKHGGKTPKGDNWHRPLWPHRDAPGANTKLNRKLNDLQRTAAKREKRVARMSPEERAAHEQWQRTHKPGSAAERQRQREFRRQAKESRLLLSAEPPPAPTPEAQELQKLIDQLKAELLELEFRKGVFA
ncbi:hypothetical protein LB559_16175 [Mesorhizobium sp. BR1-1-3]|uniref:hypothetical protein n=1 Tax=Mesorhizobium sp. BR1-1-3 TaxID=2876651 RepID=UPI001CD0867D|nr:hypothetical protein [Mesorhizobium sp. BR1-1-3]MBZ9889464.1 hypothetical protein [Mesorhizobium sp. BR1-1-3]